jgi:hypothetical protein
MNIYFHRMISMLILCFALKIDVTMLKMEHVACSRFLQSPLKGDIGWLVVIVITLLMIV